MNMEHGTWIMEDEHGKEKKNEKGILMIND
jgi:hypothetical protein